MATVYVEIITCDPGVINSSPPEQNGRHFADIFKCIFINEKFCILIQKFVLDGSIDNNPALD